MNAKKLIPVAIICAILIIGFAVWKVGLFHKMTASKVQNTSDLTTLTKNVKLELMPLNADDHALGNPSAPVQIIEYADTTCSHCADMEEILSNVLDQKIKDGKVVWIFRNFLSDTKNNTESRYLECVAKVSGNDKFWTYLNKLFATEARMKTEDFLIKEAKNLGTSENKLNDCLKTDYADKHIENDMTGGIAAGVIGTPYIFIIGSDKSIHQIVGYMPEVTVEATINQVFETN